MKVCFTLPTSINNIIRFRKKDIKNIPLVAVVFASNIFSSYKRCPQFLPTKIKMHKRKTRSE